jgi:hypothetical protein
VWFYESVSLMIHNIPYPGNIQGSSILDYILDKYISPLPYDIWVISSTEGDPKIWGAYTPQVLACAFVLPGFGTEKGNLICLGFG